jgi:hypothetical protein
MEILRLHLTANPDVIWAILRRKENFACVRILYWGTRRKTEHLDVARIGRERTRNKTWFTRDWSSIR